MFIIIIILVVSTIIIIISSSSIIHISIIISITSKVDPHEQARLHAGLAGGPQ